MGLRPERGRYLTMSILDPTRHYWTRIVNLSAIILLTILDYLFALCINPRGNGNS